MQRCISLLGLRRRHDSSQTICGHRKVDDVPLHECLVQNSLTMWVGGKVNDPLFAMGWFFMGRLARPAGSACVGGCWHSFSVEYFSPEA